MIKDGLVLFYVKNEMIYPVALTEEQQEAFELMQFLMKGTLHVIDKPTAKAVDLMDLEVLECER
ncbi:hypothetical protein [Brevibacillus laterosporus]|uniref:hypothetical protein n=1 Tax=Brevibacillus laterosporus TaxID=1465 RepID=UPI002E1AE949|nr:hypothetical protein [Brevibacillus laterosporus]MED1667221.1 hypothetical protein [Brevibacillus laterosporus]MED1719711.1 hypothetical protein [Brevibacillus laterosporus]